MKNAIRFISIVLLVGGCGQKNQTSDSDSQSDLEEQIIFYSLTDQEFDSLNALETDDGLNESFADFSYYASNVLDSMKKTDLRTYVTTKRYINLKDKVIDKFDYSGYGIILIRSDSIYIESSVYTDIDYFMTITEFFDL